MTGEDQLPRRTPRDDGGIEVWKGVARLEREDDPSVHRQVKAVLVGYPPPVEDIATAAYRFGPVQPLPVAEIEPDPAAGDTSHPFTDLLGPQPRWVLLVPNGGIPGADGPLDRYVCHLDRLDMINVWGGWTARLEIVAGIDGTAAPAPEAVTERGEGAEIVGASTYSA